MIRGVSGVLSVWCYKHPLYLTGHLFPRFGNLPAILLKVFYAFNMKLFFYYAYYLFV